MFRIGEKVVYPMHGAGIVESIEEREFLGVRQAYYVLRLPVGEMRVLIPVNGVAEAGLRRVIPAEQVEEVLGILRKGPGVTATSANWNHRYRGNLEKIRSGDIFQVAEVVWSLAQRDRDKGLSTGERRMLENARQILVSELVLAREIPEPEAAELVRSLLA